MPHAALILVGGALLAPLVTWLPMLAIRFPELGLPPYDPALGIDAWQLQTFWFVVVLAGGLTVWHSGGFTRRDQWLACAIVLAGLGVFVRGARLDPTHAIVFVAGALAIAIMREAPWWWHRRIALSLAALGVFQALYMLHQWAGYDLLWGRLVGATTVANPQMLGTIGTVAGASAYVALTAPLMPWYLLPLALAVIWMGDSRTALASVAVGLAVRYRRSRAAWLIGGVLMGALLWWRSYILTQPKGTVAPRLAMWGFGLSAWWREAPWFGWGLGGWGQRVPALQIERRFVPAGVPEIWREAHNEWLQWLVEAGLIGAAIFACWLIAWRRMFLDDLWGGSLAALAVNALGFFPLHVPALALVAIVIVGLATSQNRELRDAR